MSIDLQNLAGFGADGLADAVAMLWPPLQRLQNKEVERALKQLYSILITMFHKNLWM